MKILITLVAVICQIVIVLAESLNSGDAKIMKPFNLPNKEDCICPFIYRPVCASDRQTYPNSCVLNCIRKYENPFLLGICQGECPCCKEPYENELIEFENLPFPPPPSGWGDQPPSSIGLPMPNTDDRQSNIEGKAKAPNCICTDDYTPVCGNDGKTYSNQCQLDCAAKTNPDLKTVCKQKCPCECVCDCTGPVEV